MIRLRPSEARGRFRNHWLDARFSFSFGNYRDPAFDGYSDLWVLNEDIVAPGGGFAEHEHEDVEVMSYPVSGAVEHRDSLGNVATLRPGDVHLMRAGRGIRHSEMNASATEPEHHLQWWIRPATRGLAPGYQRIHVDASDKRGRFRMLASPEPADGVLHIAQDARVYAALLDDAPARHVLAAGRRGYVHVVSGVAQVGGYRLEAGDAAFVEGEAVTARSAVAGAVTELLLFDLR